MLSLARGMYLPNNVKKVTNKIMLKNIYFLLSTLFAVYRDHIDNRKLKGVLK